jgi:branched-chain amino acid transport system ATP-binding protein
MLRVRSLEAGYGGLTVLRHVSLHVKPGEIVAIIGANGAGKSTLLNTIAGLIRPRGGQVLLDGTDISFARPENIVRRGASLVREGRHVFMPLTVLENLTLGAYAQVRRGNDKEVEEDLAAIFAVFPRLAERKKQLAGTLSGGEQQMLAMGRALMSRPRLLMLDEPSMGLSPILVKEIFNVIARLTRAGMTLLLVEQNAVAALKVADRGYVLETGSIVLEGSSEDLQNNREVQRAYLGKEYKKINE